MRISTLLLPFLCAVAVAACSSEEATQPPSTQKTEPPAAKKGYDSGRGGVQITAIYYNQGKNKELTNLEDEWLVIQSDRDISLDGWMLDAGDNQVFTFDGPIHRQLLVYTKAGPITASSEIVALNYGNWIWNNAEPDTARLLDDKGDLVDTMTY